MFYDFLLKDNFYNPNDIEEVIKIVRPNFKFAYSNKGIKYFNIPCAFDIETSSFFRLNGKEQEKVAIMYGWTFGIYGITILGRTWPQFVKMLDRIQEILCLDIKKRVIIYVHNLGYEFQFMRGWLSWEKVFSIDTRKPIYANTVNGFEFRCSYLLSGYSLEKLAENLRECKIKKLVGYLDYEKIRHSQTELTHDEIMYMLYDVKIVMAYIQELINRDGDIARIPLTKTGYVRNYCRQSCFYDEDKPRKKSFKYSRYSEIMKSLQLVAEEYKQLKRAFQGGFTHANPFFSGKLVENVTSFDFTSSYPAVMVCEKFPMSKGEVVEIKSREDFYKNLKLYCCLFDVEFVGLQSKLYYENPISQSRCWGVKKAVVNNGRIVSAECLYTTLTETDFKIVENFYTWDKIKIANFRRYKKDYLPTDFVKAILKLYENKTTLKGVEGKEVEYLNSKEMLNSCYGMAVTDIVREEITYINNVWGKEKDVDFEKEIAKYNKSRSRFLFYPWGVWVTAYARRNLFTGICEFGKDYIYSDTDSIKVINADKHKSYIDNYNATIKKMLEKALKYHGLPLSYMEPETIKGDKKCLGVWDFDGHYKKFKTLGAKRYLVMYSDNPLNPASKHNTYSLTVAGLGKKNAIKYVLEKYGENGIFEAFNNNLYIPADNTGKNTHTYIDDMREGEITDYAGVKARYFEISAVHLEKCDYSLSISREYTDYLLNIENVEM